MLVQGKRPRELRWYHAGPFLFGDWGTSRLYVLGLCFFYNAFSSLWFMLAMSALLLWVGWAYQVICRLYPDGGGVYSSARHRSRLLGVVGGLLLCADYVVTAAISALDAFHYVDVPHPVLWAVVSLAVIGLLNYFGPKKSGTGALVVAVLTVVLTLIIAIAALPSMGRAQIAPAPGTPVHWWTQFSFIILAISGVEAVANMTGIMVAPVEKTARKAIVPVMLEIVILNILLTLAMQALPAAVLGGGDASEAAVRTAHRDDMLRLLAEYYVGPVFAVVASIVFALLLLSAVNTALTGLVSIQYTMSRDRELPATFGGLNQWGMPVFPLVLGTLVPLIVVLVVRDVGKLADLYAIGVTGAVAVNLSTCSTNFRLKMAAWERCGMLALAVVMVLIWLTIAWEKPAGFVFAVSIMGVGLVARWCVHNREQIQTWVRAKVPAAVPGPQPAPAVEGEAAAEPAVPTYTPIGRIVVATRSNPKLVKFAIEEAKSRQAELLILFVRQLAVIPMGTTSEPDVSEDAEASTIFAQAKKLAGEKGVPLRLLYAVAEDVADAILDLSVTYGADLLILGATQRGALWRTMKGDVIQQVAQYLPENTSMLIHV